MRPLWNGQPRRREYSQRRVTPDMTPGERVKFHSVPDEETECWVWQLVPSAKGYGTLTINYQPHPAHRVAYEAFVAPIPDGLVIDHLCRNRMCVNPDHLEPVTPGENVLRGIGRSAENARKTHCKHGHEFNGENTYLTPDGRRRCRTCIRGWQRDFTQRRRELAS